MLSIRKSQLTNIDEEKLSSTSEKGDLTKTCNGDNATKTCNGANATKSSVGADSSKVCLEDDSTESFRGESTNHLDQVIFSFFIQTFNASLHQEIQL